MKTQSKKTIKAAVKADGFEFQSLAISTQFGAHGMTDVGQSLETNDEGELVKNRIFTMRYLILDGAEIVANKSVSFAKEDLATLVADNIDVYNALVTLCENLIMAAEGLTDADLITV